jgi:hypothetical protein
MATVALRTLVATLLTLALLLVTLPAAAVVVELKSGRRLEGELRDASAARVTLEAGGEVLVLEANEVRAIYFTTAGSAPAPAAATPPRPLLPGADALEAVKALRASVAGGTSAREFSPRVVEARAAVDRYLATLPGAVPPGGAALRDAITYYQVSEFAWRNHSVASHTVWLRRDDVLERCQPYREFVEAMQAKGESHYSERTSRFTLISDGVLTVLWSCAAVRIEEAEQSLLP